MTGKVGFLPAHWPQPYGEARDAERDAIFDAQLNSFADAG